MDDYDKQGKNVVIVNSASKNTNILNNCNYMVVVMCQREKGGALSTVMVDYLSIDHVDHTGTLVINVPIAGKYK